MLAVWEKPEFETSSAHGTDTPDRSGPLHAIPQGSGSTRLYATLARDAGSQHFGAGRHFHGPVVLTRHEQLKVLPRRNSSK